MRNKMMALTIAANSKAKLDKLDRYTHVGDKRAIVVCRCIGSYPLVSSLYDSIYYDSLK
jgi:hypothetical protein